MKSDEAHVGNVGEVLIFAARPSSLQNRSLLGTPSESAALSAALWACNVGTFAAFQWDLSTRSRDTSISVIAIACVRARIHNTVSGRRVCFERFFRPARKIAAADTARLRVRCEREKPVYFPQYYQLDYVVD